MTLAHQTESIVIPHILISSFSLWVIGKESHTLSGHRAGGNKQMATNEIFVFRSVLNRSHIPAICRFWRGYKKSAKSYKLNPITVACGHKKGPALSIMQILCVTCHTCHIQARGDTCTNSVVTCPVSDKWHVSHIPNQFQFTLRRNIFLFPAALLAGVCRPHAGPGSVCRIVISSQHFAADFSTGVWSLEIWLQSVWAECDVWSLASHRISQSDLVNHCEAILWSHYPRKWPVNIGPGPSRSTQTWNLAIKYPQNTRLEQFTFLW